jgi:hypothetical protein
MPIIQQSVVNNMKRYTNRTASLGNIHMYCTYIDSN